MDLPVRVRGLHPWRAQDHGRLQQDVVLLVHHHRTRHAVEHLEPVADPAVAVVPAYGATAEEPEGDTEAEEDGDNQEHAEERLKEIREELQEKARQLGDMRQVVKYQKMHISALKGELAELRKADEADLHRRRSSVRSKTLRARDSLRVSRHTSVRVSRPPSSFFD